jgi:hypothetical protein
MNEIKSQLELINERMYRIELEVDSFTLHGRGISHAERLLQIGLLDEWAKLNTAKLVLVDVLDAIESNLRN